MNKKASAPDLIPVAEVIPSTIEQIDDDDYILIKPDELNIFTHNGYTIVQYKKNITINLFYIDDFDSRYIQLLKMKAWQKNYVFMFRMENASDEVYSKDKIKKFLKFSRN